ncbi:SDR family oxidoreductase [Nocardia macrotermitis]|uniref:3-oxoacyl-[acyl-carrier-protein] reductase FabG n=1 Tax=Nocardia macrotermitis TaxID=2585198 RepID=A0A7K0D798_9NOCA|nr:SDR family oxidoreductase [Nocardia macrotermitis]MQY21222.1 3-oxoacyl-[acyl-carrier-protein] reductase FabG [Nocardia macrotermitis]
MVDLNGRVALVTGGGKGIGRGISTALAAAGASVAVNYATDRAAADSTVADIAASGGRAVAVPGDVAVPEDVERMFAQVNATIGAVDTLVNNAGIYTFQPFEDVTPDDFERHYRTNVLGVILTCQSFVKQVPGVGGSIVNISTSGIANNAPGPILSTSSKAAVTTLTRILANELGPRQIRVNAVAPGATDTDGARALGLINDELVAAVVAATPLGRLGHPDDIGPVVAFLASREAAWITGDVVFASGGSR